MVIFPLHLVAEDVLNQGYGDDLLNCHYMFLALTESENKVKEKHNSGAYILNLPLTLTM